MPLTMINVIYGQNQLTNPDGTAAQGVITLRAVQEVPASDYTIIAAPKTFTLVNGNISGTIASNGAPSLQYMVWEQIINQVNPLPYLVAAPSGSTLDLSVAPRSTISQTSPLYVLASALGVASGVATLGPDGVLTVSQRPSAGTGTVTSVSAGSARVAIGGAPTVTPSVDVVLDATATDIAPLGVQAAGSTGRVPDAGHVHPMPRLDQLGAPTGAVSLAGQKVTGVANGSAAQDATAYGQVVPASTATTKGDILVATGAAAIARLGVGSDGQVLAAASGQSTGVGWATPTVYKPTVRYQWITNPGDAALPNTAGAWIALSGFELDVPANIGDYVEIGAHAMRSNTSTAFLDVAVIVGTSLVRFMASGSATPGVEGDPGFYFSNNFTPQSGSRGFTVTSGDRDGANVRFVVATNAQGSGTLYSSSNYPFYWRALNLGPTN